MTSHGTLHRAWATWVEAAAARRLKTAKLQAMLQHMRCARGAAALRGWREAAARSRLLRSKAGAVVARLTHRTLASAFAGAGWVGCLSLERRSVRAVQGHPACLPNPLCPNASPSEQAGARRTPSSRPSTACCSRRWDACSRALPRGACSTGARPRGAGPSCAAWASGASCGCRRWLWAAHGPR